MYSSSFSLLDAQDWSSSIFILYFYLECHVVKGQTLALMCLPLTLNSGLLAASARMPGSLPACLPLVVVVMATVSRSLELHISAHTATK